MAGVIPSGYVDPPYPTDPQHYDFAIPAGRGATTYKVFTDPADALRTIGEGRLAVVSVYVRKQGAWVFQEVETNRLMLGL